MMASFFTKFDRFEVGLNFNTLANVDFSLINSLVPHKEILLMKIMKEFMFSFSLLTYAFC